MTLDPPEYTRRGDPPENVQATCRGCGATLATILVVGRPNGHGGAPARETSQLARGYVNAKGRHPAGVAWFKPGPRDGLAASPKARQPFVITCRCGKDSLLSRS